MKRFNSVDEYINSCEQFKDIAKECRTLFNSTEMVETIKWGIPAYTVDQKNIVGFAEFKNWFAIWFHQGVYLKDPNNVLINAQEGKTQALRQWRFESLEEFKSNLPLIKQYIDDAIENHKQGKTIKVKQKTKPLLIPDLLANAFKSDSQLESCFSSLTLGKQRDYAEYIDTAKRDETKQSRLEKIIPMIKSGIGLNDKYQK